MSRTALSAMPPCARNPQTRAPGENPWAWFAATTVPATSYPGANGGSGLLWYKPLTWRVSAKLTATDSTSTKTVPGLGSGSGSSPTLRASIPS